MELRFIGSYVEECKANPTRFAAGITSPMLIVKELGSSDDEDDAAFQTKFMSRADFLAAGSGERSLDAEPSVGVGHVFPIKKREGGAFPDRIGVGRAPNVDVRVSLSQVSKYHAYFSKNPDGSWSLTDAGSRNGTSVRGTKLADRMPTTIADASDVVMGPYRFTFHTAEGFVELVKRRAAVAR